jgi:hypothetical protein
MDLFGKKHIKKDDLLLQFHTWNQLESWRDIIFVDKGNLFWLREAGYNMHVI